MFSLFISHQWLGRQCADPTGQQLAILRDALRNVIAGNVKVESDMIYLLMFRRVDQLTAEEVLQLSRGYIWSDSQDSKSLTKECQCAASDFLKHVCGVSGRRWKSL